MKYNTISFNEYDIPYEDRPGELYKDISDTIRILLKNDYQLKIWKDDMTIVIEYDYKDVNMTGNNLIWINEEEEDKSDHTIE